MCNMHFFTSCLVLLVGVFGSSAAIFDSLFAPRSGCTILCTVPLNPFDPYYKAELFPSLNAKLSANQNRYDRNLGQVWVDSPDPTACGFPSFGGARCCLNAIYNPQYEWNDFQSGEKKKIANEQLWADAQAQRLNYYKVWADAPERFCKRRYGVLGDIFG